MHTTTSFGTQQPGAATPGPASAAPPQFLTNGALQQQHAAMQQAAGYQQPGMQYPGFQQTAASLGQQTGLQQPSAAGQTQTSHQTGPPKTLSSFQTSLTSCCGTRSNSCLVCVVGAVCPAVIYGDNYNRIHGNGFFPRCCLYLWCGALCGCVFAATTRQQLRLKYGLREEPCSDCCVHCWCSTCALCQEARELQLRGAAPASGVAAAGMMGGPQPTPLQLAAMGQLPGQLPMPAVSTLGAPGGTMTQGHMTQQQQLQLQQQQQAGFGGTGTLPPQTYPPGGMGMAGAPGALTPAQQQAMMQQAALQAMQRPLQPLQPLQSLQGQQQQQHMMPGTQPLQHTQPVMPPTGTQPYGR
ncbi:hypothetical protein HYH02_000808 [Chlamydomonas schloesseri]|uniref:Uncharacterized protein n=1 Tax=Chlamydomonas schloesseri TaxID=2026947 RepID=A0A835WX07_9CHLO|nr:hypothetical protein HYH02_000808 [Chlamydomonas schloesseri]|eukprot:KAG2454982.1 hypothetical protein HYH02_000808 [Chlamydomonas schloesseri]